MIPLKIQMVRVIFHLVSQRKHKLSAGHLTSVQNFIKVIPLLFKSILKEVLLSTFNVLN